MFRAVTPVRTTLLTYVEASLVRPALAALFGGQHMAAVVIKGIPPLSGSAVLSGAFACNGKEVYMPRNEAAAVSTIELQGCTSP
jgi:hypothetical protein